MRGLSSQTCRPRYFERWWIMKSNYNIAVEVIAGKWGNGAERKEKLTAAGYNYSDVQSIVNALMSGSYTPEPEPAAAAPVRKTLAVEYDPEQYDGIEVTVLI